MIASKMIIETFTSGTKTKLTIDKNNLPLPEQKNIWKKILDKYQGNYDKRDDITVLGTKL